MKKIVILFIFIIYIMQSDWVYANSYKCHVIGNQWQWYDDYFSLYIKYYVVGFAGRKYEVATGVSISGEPRGQRRTISGKGEIVGYGIGALYIRKSDVGEDFKVCATAETIETIAIIKKEF